MISYRTVIYADKLKTKIYAAALRSECQYVLFLKTSNKSGGSIDIYFYIYIVLIIIQPKTGSMLIIYL